MRLNEIVETGDSTVLFAESQRQTTTPEAVTLVADRLGFWYGDAFAADFTDLDLST